LEYFFRVVALATVVAPRHQHLTNFLVEGHGLQGTVYPTGVVVAQEFWAFLGENAGCQKKAGNGQGNAHGAGKCDFGQSYVISYYFYNCLKNTK